MMPCGVVSHWMSANRPKLNPDKTELLWAGSTYSRSSLGSSYSMVQTQMDRDCPRNISILDLVEPNRIREVNMHFKVVNYLQRYTAFLPLSNRSSMITKHIYLSKTTAAHTFS